MDNLKILHDLVVEKINNSNGPGSIKAIDHQNILTEFIQKSGRYTGFPYRITLNGNNGVIANGVLSYNGQAMNQSGTFVLYLSANTLDMNPIQPYLDLMVEDSLIHIKDFLGRSVIYQYVTHTLGFDNSENPIIELSVKSVKGNTNYVYSQNENNIASIEFFTKGSNNSSGETGTSESFAILSGNETLSNLRKNFNLRSSQSGITVNIDNSLDNEFSCFLDNAYEQMFITVANGVVASGDIEGKAQPYVIPKNGNVWIYKSSGEIRIKGDIL